MDAASAYFLLAGYGGGFRDSHSPADPRYPFMLESNSSS
jgi:hypothetical protein